MVAHSRYARAHSLVRFAERLRSGENVVVVEADRYKASDPLMDHMVKRGAPNSLSRQPVLPLTTCVMLQAHPMHLQPTKCIAK